MKWDGEWHITYEVFRDLGLAFAAVLVLIYILVVAWFQSFKTPLVIMAAIPFSLVGILPGHWAMGAFFTATSMIGFIAGAGIVVRNSIILVDFIELRLRMGEPLAQAVVDAGAVRFRPMMLTAAAVVVGSAVILFDPIFQGLAISLMAGEVASLLLSRMTVPVLFYIMRRRELRRSQAGARRDVPQSIQGDRMKDQRRFPPERVLVATDLGEASAAAMSAAATSIGHMALRVHVLHAHHFEPPLYFSSGQLQSLTEELRESARAAEKHVVAGSTESPGLFRRRLPSQRHRRSKPYSAQSAISTSTSS